MELLSANRTALAEHHPHLLAAIENTAARPKSPAVPEAFETLLQSNLGQRTRFVCQVGIGTGYGRELKALIGAQPDRYGVLIEPNPEAFAAALCTTDLSALLARPEQFDWLIGLDLSQTRQRLDALCGHSRFLFFGRSYLVFHGQGTEDVYPYRELKTAFDAAAKTGIHNTGNDAQDALLGLKNILDNRKTIAERPTISALRNLLAGHPAVIASAGPSLEKALPLLKNLPKHVALFCPDTSQRILLEQGIRPHIAASKERKQVTIDHFRGLKSDEITLICSPVLQAEIFSHHRGEIGFFTRTIDFRQWLELDHLDEEFVGSSGNMAFKLAVIAGCDPIVLVGQDLSFSGDGKTHAKGAASGERQAWYEQDVQVEFPSNDGSMTRTCGKWLGFLRSFEVDISISGRRVINTTLSGARIAGAEVLSLEQVLQDLSQEKGEDPTDSIRRAFASYPSDRSRRYQTQLDSKMQRTREVLDTLLSISSLAQQYADKFIKEGYACGVRKVDLGQILRHDPFQTLEGLRNRMIREDFDIFNSFVGMLIQPIMIRLEMDRYQLEVEEDSVKVVCDRLLRLYKTWFAEIDAVIVQAKSILKKHRRPQRPLAFSRKKTNPSNRLG